MESSKGQRVCVVPCSPCTYKSDLLFKLNATPTYSTLE
jgi:hypothetical protein